MRLLVEGVSHDFGGLCVLDNVSFEVAGNEVAVVIGPSGCGKSTLLSIIGGLLRPTAGTVAIEGAPPENSLNPITFVFQDFALLPWRTVAQNVASGSSITACPRHASRRSSATRSPAPGSPIFRTCCRSSSRAACASGSASRARSRCGRRFS